jgi:hypothetical protein
VDLVEGEFGMLVDMAADVLQFVTRVERVVQGAEGPGGGILGEADGDGLEDRCDFRGVDVGVFDFGGVFRHDSALNGRHV